MALSVLVVEKDELTRLTIVYMLESLNYHVVDAEDADTAIKMLRGVRFDVLILTLTRNDPSGKAVATEAKALQPHLKVIVVSGVRGVDSLDIAVDVLIPKPFTLNQINDAIKDVRASIHQSGDDDPKIKASPVIPV